IIGVQTPCTIVVKRNHYFDLWKNAPDRLDALRHPYLILYLQAAKHFADIYRKRLESNTKLRSLTGKEFWKRWELQYLRGGLFDGDLLAERIRSTYDELVRRYGDFLTTGGNLATSPDPLAATRVSMNPNQPLKG